MPPLRLQSRPNTIPCPPAPQMCRLAEMTYCADITVDIEYTRGREIVVKRGENGVGAVQIGRLPLMLRSDRCRLKGCSEAQLAALGARPATPAPPYVTGTSRLFGSSPPPGCCRLDTTFAQSIVCHDNMCVIKIYHNMMMSHPRGWLAMQGSVLWTLGATSWSG